MIPKVKFTLHDSDGNFVKKLVNRGPNAEIAELDDLKPRDDTRVLFGWTAQPKQIPWQVQFINYGELQCSGTLVASNKIVSAAHCFDKENFPTKTDTLKPDLEYLVARAGNVNATRSEDGSQERKCSDIIIHS